MESEDSIDDKANNPIDSLFVSKARNMSDRSLQFPNGWPSSVLHQLLLTSLLEYRCTHYCRSFTLHSRNLTLMQSQSLVNDLHVTFASICTR